METKRLLFRPWKEEDSDRLYCLASDPDIGPAAGWPAHKSVEESRNIIINVLSASGTFALVEKSTNLVIGSIGITRPRMHYCDTEKDFELGFWIGKEYWGRSYIPEAIRECLRYCFEEFSADRVWCAYYEGNHKSRRTQEKCGFKYHHTEAPKLCELIDEVRTEHVNFITENEYKKSISSF